MSKIVYICNRNEKKTLHSRQDIKILSQRLVPDNIEPRDPYIINNDGVLVGIISPVDILPIKNNSVCMGYMVAEQSDWWKPNADIPDGTYALFRCDDNTIEIVTDVVASRTVWYVQTEDQLLASTSQRAIVLLLKSFDLNEDVFPWMISSGTLGPGLSWDRRINMLPGNTRLVLDRKSWSLAIIREPLNYLPANISTKEHENNLKKAIESAFSRLDLDFNKWRLPLSGGVDSRAILLMLKDRPGLKVLTWGLRSSQHNKNNDAYIANQLSEYFDVEHEYFETDVSHGSVEDLLTRFLIAGEGRVDNISGYMDGFRIWKILHDTGTQGVIRGDEAFGCHAVKNSTEVYKNMGLLVLEDYDNLRRSLKCFHKNIQQRPAALLKKENETLEEWRDRLNREYEFPTIFAALNDLKLAYVEIINPLISHSIVEQVMSLPDNLRTGKSLFTRIVVSLCPDIKFAKHAAIETRNNILRKNNVVSVIIGELETAHSRKLFEEEFLGDVLSRIVSTDNGNDSRIKRLSDRIIRKISKRLSFRKTNDIDMNSVAFRLYLISKMTRLLLDDAQALNS